MIGPDYYDILGLGPEAEDDDILEAYQRARAMLRQGQAGQDVGRIRMITEAYMVLIDPLARAEYDASCIGEALIDETVNAITDVDLGSVERLIMALETREQELQLALQDPESPAPKKP